MGMNPFRDSIVRDPWRSGSVDVPEINETAFRRCCEALELLRESRGSTSVLLHGEAGSGKTHLLGRLRSHVEALDDLAIFVSIRLNCGPQRFWRHTRRCLVDNLARRRQGKRTQLDELLIERLVAHCGGSVACRDPRPRKKELRPYIEEISLHAELTRDMCRVIDHLVFRRHRLEALAWLRGESLPEEELKKLGLSTAQEDEGDPEAVARDVVRSLCRLAGAAIPVIFCFDQIEALQRHEGDREGIFVLGKAIRSLYDMVDNVLIISCVQSYFLEKLERTMQEPNYDALAVQIGSLKPVVPSQALKLAKARLESADLSSEQRSKLVTVFQRALPKQIEPEGLSARRVLGACAAIYDSWEGSAKRETPKKSRSDFLEDEFNRRQEDSLRTLQESGTDEIVQSSIPVLVNLFYNHWREVDEGRPRDVDVLLESKGRRLGISICNEQNMTSLAARFRRLKRSATESNLDRFFILRHAQRPITSTAKKTRQYLDELQTAKAQLLRPDSELLASLDALRSILADAKAGDLEDQGKTLSPATVAEWIQKNLEGVGKEFVDEIVSEGRESRASISTESEKLLEDLMALLEQHRVLSLKEAAKRIEHEDSLVEDVVRAHPQEVGYLAGPPAVLFHYVPDSAPVD